MVEECTVSDVLYRKNITFESPATYRIRIKGHIDDSLSDQLGGMIITRAFTADKQPMTILVGSPDGSGGLVRCSG